MMPRGASLSDSSTPDHCRTSALIPNPINIEKKICIETKKKYRKKNIEIIKYVGEKCAVFYWDKVRLNFEESSQTVILFFVLSTQIEMLYGI